MQTGDVTTSMFEEELDDSVTHHCQWSIIDNTSNAVRDWNSHQARLGETGWFTSVRI
jgi:hypothetical protein